MGGKTPSTLEVKDIKMTRTLYATKFKLKTWPLPLSISTNHGELQDIDGSTQSHIYGSPQTWAQPWKAASISVAVKSFQKNIC